ncbi:hypothetical protein Bcop_1869 [Bacteroides coprosuis DSM 18011]|uniref:Polysaccharide pyruvyl transferase domain-containing protein n=1 Tax=Bacteroides coprosuis DSM 18011 TaxID=679937 RepID=F3ZS36_9BACE|nr:polysaccharide pyruvyl transferase family protein [Bacteroides coprosuis]EGJ72057.1 hypothetical protein Bcop_1869 [Bacteroides coprosuis DSM 18011]
MKNNKKIGILTFHWATNYGAILQVFALQTVLQQMGCEVHIINYKPRQFDNNVWTFLRYRKFLNLRAFIHLLNKEHKMKIFRAKHLDTTPRYYTQRELRQKCEDFDVLISGSDQVLNPSFLQYGENGKSTAYYLDFGSNNTKRVCYAVSFGVTKYPNNLLEMVRPIVASIDAISVREETGQDLFIDMGRQDTIVVPDPTLLLPIDLYLKRFNITKTKKSNDNYFVYMLHGKLKHIKQNLPKNICISKSETIESWIRMIYSSKAVVTNSFHGVVFCILSHTPFLAVLSTKKNEGMNDRFFTMLTRLGLEERITTEAEFDVNLMNKTIDWIKVDVNIRNYRNIGITFLQENINYK